MTELTIALRNLGFTQQEAILYIKLSKAESMTGYEAAKVSGISRSNAYASLSSLVEKGYAFTVEGNPVKYIAVPKEDLLANAKRDFASNMELIEDKLEETIVTHEPYITVTGEKSVLDKLKNIIAQAELRIYLSANEKILEALEEELIIACERGLKVVILSSRDISCGEHIFYATDRDKSIKLIADTKEVLAGTLAQSLYSKNTTLVNIIKEAIIDEITLITKGSNLS